MSWSKLLKDLMTAPSWRQCQFIVERYPEVLLPPYDEELLTFIKLAKSQSPRDARIAEELRSVLQRCREVGVNKAFDEKVNNVVFKEDFGRILPYPDYFTEAELLRFFTALRDRNYADIGELYKQMGNKGIALTAFLTDDGSNIKVALQRFPALRAIFDPDEIDRGRDEMRNVMADPKQGRRERF